MGTIVLDSQQALKTRYVATRRLMWWVGWATYQGPLSPVATPYYREVLKKIKAFFAEFEEEKNGGLPFITYPNWEDYFLMEIFFTEINLHPWGRVILSQGEAVLGTPYPPIPWFVLPTECISCGEPLGLSAYDLSNPQKRMKLRHDVNEDLETCRHEWRKIQKMVKTACDCFCQLADSEEASNMDAHFLQNIQTAGVAWDAYSYFSEKFLEAKRPYTPRYALFKEYQDVSFDWVQRIYFGERVNLDGIPFLNCEGKEEIPFHELGDYFRYPTL